MLKKEKKVLEFSNDICLLQFVRYIEVKVSATCETKHYRILIACY